MWYLCTPPLEDMHNAGPRGLTVVVMGARINTELAILREFQAVALAFFKAATYLFAVD